MVETAAGKFRWVNVEHPSNADVDELRRDFGFDERDLRDLTLAKQRPKFEVRPQGPFLILLFPTYIRERRAIAPVELDVFLGRDFLVTVHDGALPAVRDRLTAHRTGAGPTTPLAALLDVLDDQFDSIPPMLEHISIDENAIESSIFAGRDRTMVEEILVVRRNITEFRRTMQAHRSLLKRFLVHLERAEARPGERVRVADLVSRTYDIWEQLESQKETIEALQESNESLISFRLNDIMKTFTTMSVIIFAMTLVATVFTIRATGTPFLSSPGAFWIVVGLLAVVGAGLFTFFKRRRWV
jgi:magnesium transporter